MNFEEIKENIIDKYKELGLGLGWRFLYGSKTTLTDNNGILFISLNPGGVKAGKNQGEASCENGHALLDEIWPKNNEVERQENGEKIKTKPGESTLQKQIQEIFKIIGIEWNQDRDILIKKSLSGYFIPFRSPDWESFDKDKVKEATIFAKKTWKGILKDQKVKLIICIDKITFKNLKSILIELEYKEDKSENKKIGWGEYSYDKIEYSIGEKQKLVLIRFPHLSTYKIFSRSESKVVAEELLRDTCETLV